RCVGSVGSTGRWGRLASPAPEATHARAGLYPARLLELELERELELESSSPLHLAWLDPAPRVLMDGGVAGNGELSSSSSSSGRIPGDRPYPGMWRPSRATAMRART